MVRTDSTNRLGVAIACAAFESIGFAFREQPTSDFGIDAHAELRAGDRGTGEILGIQIKSGTSYFREAANDQGWWIRPDLRHVEYWLNHVLPVVIVLVDVDKKSVFWVAATNTTIQFTDSGAKILVPNNRRVGRDSFTALLRLLRMPDLDEPVAQGAGCQVFLTSSISGREGWEAFANILVGQLAEDGHVSGWDIIVRVMTSDEAFQLLQDDESGWPGDNIVSIEVDAEARLATYSVSQKEAENMNLLWDEDLRAVSQASAIVQHLMAAEGLIDDEDEFDGEDDATENEADGPAEVPVSLNQRIRAHSNVTRGVTQATTIGKSTVTSPDNPFLLLTQSFNPESYYGSQACVEIALQCISGTPAHSIELHGLPGMGKSFLLRYLADPDGALKRSAGMLQPPYDESPSRLFPLLVEFRLRPSDIHPFVYIFKRFHEEFERYREVAYSALSGLLHDAIGNRGRPQSPGEAATAIEDVLLGLKDAGVRTAFLLDDFHLAFRLLTASETVRLRPWRDAAAFIVATESRLHKVNVEAAGSPFYQTLTLVPFGGLSRDEAWRLVAAPAEDAGWAFDSDDIQFVVEQAGVHPLLLVLAGRALWDSRNSVGYARGKRAAVSKEYPELLVGRFKGWFHPTFQMYWEHLGTEEHYALAVSVSHDKEISPGCYSVLTSLEQLGMVRFDPVEGRYRPFAPLFGEYISERSLNSAELKRESQDFQ